MTGLRGVAAFLVVIYHFYSADDLPSGALRHFVTKGYLWVDLFFVLSGFLMAMNYGHSFAGRWPFRAWRAFLFKRFARIYPLYGVIVLGTLAYTLAVHGSLQGVPNTLPSVDLHNPAVEIAANLFLVQSWGVARSIDGVAWSLSTEWAAYLLFPILAWLALFARSRTALAVAVGAAAVIVGTVGLTSADGAYHSGPLDAYDGTTIEPILRCLGGFTLGLLTFRLTRSPRILAWASCDPVAGAAVVLLAAGFAAGAYDLIVYPLFAAVVLALYGNRGRVGRAFGCRPVHWMGLISYSLYLLHLYFVGPRQWLGHWFQARLPAGWAAVATDATVCAALLGASALAYRVVEEPGRRCAQRVNKACAAAVLKARPKARMAA
jgi:peptidoglycan/LPS O-acetylase OafA/YrhL